MIVRREVDREKVEQFVKHASDQVAAGFNCSVSYLGDQLGLYKIIDKEGPLTSEQLAVSTGLHERWLREWLRHQACVGHLEYQTDADAFYLTPEAAVVLCDDDNPMFFASGFAAIASTHAALPKMPDVFRTGLGLSYDEHGEGCACGIERLNNYFPRNELVPKLIPQLDGIEEHLRQGAKVADVGCGSGIAVIEMAKAFPNSSFVGYDNSKHALERASHNLAENDLHNLAFVDPTHSPLPNDRSMDFVTTFDVIHDTPYPAEMIEAIYGSLKPEGTWLCSDIKSFPTFEKNLTENPSAALFYGFSLMVCMSSSMSTPDGAGLGTLGFNEKVAREMTKNAGFTRFEMLEIDKGINNYYQIRP